MAIELMPVQPEDRASVLALNLESEQYLAPMHHAEFDWFVEHATAFRSVQREGVLAGFLIALGPGLTYPSDNYRWFSERYNGFLYIDRIVIGSGHRGLGVGRSVYDWAEGFAQQRGWPWLLAEIDTDPPNTTSLAFHARMGFEEVGQHRYGPTQKPVSLQAKPLGS